jgi:Phage portal protein
LGTLSHARCTGEGDCCIDFAKDETFMFNQLKSLFAGERKKFAASPLVSLHTVGRPQWTPRNYAAMAREGFAGNAIGYRCVRMIAEAASSVPLLLYEGEKELSAHPLKQLLARPNPAQSGRDLLENIVSFLLVAGNSYVEASSLENVPRELVSLRPDRVKVVAGSKGWPESYEYSVDGASARLAAETVLHIRLFNPLDDYYGMASSTAAPTDVEPSTITNSVGMGWDAADTSIQIMHRGAGAVTKIDLGASFPVPTADRAKAYELALYAPPGTPQYVGYEVTDLATGAVASGTITTNLPTTATLLAPRGWMSVGGASSVIGIALMGLYIETDY